MVRKETSRWWIGLGVGAPLLLGLVGLFVLERGRAQLSDGAASVARITRAEDGSCWFGAKRQHCYRLSLEVHPVGREPFSTSLDVNVEDKWASRVQPGSLIWVVQTERDTQEVALAMDTFTEPPPTLPSAASPSRTLP